MSPVKKYTAALSTLLTMVWFLTTGESRGQSPEPVAALPIKVVRDYVEQEQRPRLQHLLSEFGRHKQLPPGYELQALLALSHFPELKDVRIRFVVDDVNIPLSSRPYWASMLRSAAQRTYLVVIDSQRNGEREELLLKNQPFNAQTGIIGHELAHTVYYLDRSFFGILSDGVCQLNACRVEFERETDRRTVDYGLGWQRYDHSVFLRTSFGIDPAAAPRPGSAYLGPLELLDLMATHPAYRDTLTQR